MTFFNSSLVMIMSDTGAFATSGAASGSEKNAAKPYSSLVQIRTARKGAIHLDRVGGPTGTRQGIL